MDIAAWLHGLGLEQYGSAFRENNVDAEVLLCLTAEDLKDIGIISVGHRRKLLDAVTQLQGRPAPQPLAGAESEATGSERRQLTVMFVDLVGSTALSTMLDPEEMSEVLRRYQNCCAGEIVRLEGHVAKFMGDGVLAYFGWPKAHEDAAERAVRVALTVLRAVSEIHAPNHGPLAVRVGIATGLVVVGELLGKGAAQEQTVVGETPNLAARLQTLAEPGSVVIALSTRVLIGDLFDLADLGAQPVKGFEQPVRAWRVLGDSPAESRFEALHGQNPPRSSAASTRSGFCSNALSGQRTAKGRSSCFRVSQALASRERCVL